MNKPIQTVNDVWQVVGDDVLTRWEAIGRKHDDAHWEFGHEAFELIPEIPAMLAYEAIAKKAGVSPQTVKWAYYTVKKTPPELVNDYFELCYSVFKHAARLPEKQKEILEYAHVHKSSVSQIEALYPIVEDAEVEKAIKDYDYPRGWYGLIRDANEAGKMDKVKVHLDAIKEILK